jgi:hypothetical protein
MTHKQQETDAMCNETLWEYDNSIADLVDVPAWIKQDITAADVAAILQGGCASGAYMPAVTCHQALQTMNEHGDDVMDYIEDTLGELPSAEPGSWAGLACHYLSQAVELWAGSIEDELLKALENQEG